MYDTRTDPFQVHNLTRDRAFAGKEKQLRRLAMRLRSCSGDSCPKAYS